VRQAFRIFRKDVRALRLQIVLLMALIASFVWLDLHPISTLVIGIEVILTAAVWFLMGRAIHEDGLADDDEFWLTRPYERRSLLGSKILMAIFAVAVPLFVADAAILSFQSLPVAPHLAGLALRQVYVSLCLIVPPFAIASVSRTGAQAVLTWIAMAAIAVLTWFPGLVGINNDFRLENEKYALMTALVIAGVAAWLQFFFRKTALTRLMVAAAILLPSPPFPESAAFAIEQLRNSEPQQTARISVTATAQRIAGEAALGFESSRHCVHVPVQVDGVPPGWRVEVLSQDDRFESDGRTWTSGWHQGIARADSLSVCETGDPDSRPAALHTSIALAVYRPGKPIRVKATLNSFEAQGIGTCRFVQSAQLDTKQYMLICATAVWLPPSGEVGVAGRESPSAPIATAELPWTPFGLLPGFSPVYRWATLQIDEGFDYFDRVKGIMPRFGLKSLMKDGGEIEFRPMRRVAVLRREVSVSEVQFSN
jgi:hypothetical protein